jgi:hypothetical protein
VTRGWGRVHIKEVLKLQCKLFVKYYKCNHIMEDKMYRTCSTHEREDKYKISVGKVEGK